MIALVSFLRQQLKKNPAFFLFTGLVGRPTTNSSLNVMNHGAALSQ
jgi:hypothetical protein